MLVDVTALEFIDHRALIILDQYTAHRGAALVLRSPPDIVPRLMELIPLGAVRLEAP
jgi:hypothetical protein